MHILAASFSIGLCQASLTQSTQQTGKLVFQTSALHVRSGSLVQYSTLSSFTGAECTTNRETSISNMCIPHTFWHTHSLQHFVLFHWCLACYKQGSVSFNTVIIAVNLCSNSDLAQESSQCKPLHYWPARKRQLIKRQLLSKRFSLPFSFLFYLKFQQGTAQPFFYKKNFSPTREHLLW